MMTSHLIRKFGSNKSFVYRQSFLKVNYSSLILKSNPYIVDKHIVKQNQSPLFNCISLKKFSSDHNNSGVRPDQQGERKKETSDSSVQKLDYDDYDDYEEPKTAGQKFAFYGAVALRLSLLLLGSVCVFYTAKELFPGRMNPNSLFSEVFDILRINDQVSTFTVDVFSIYIHILNR